MTCQEFIEFLMDYIDGILPAEQRSRFDEHLSACPDCVNYLASYRDAVAWGKSAFSGASITLPPEVPVKLVQAVLAVRNRGNES